MLRRPITMVVSRMAMFALCRPEFDKSFRMETEQERCASFVSVCFLSTMKMITSQPFIVNAEQEMSLVWKCLLFVDREYMTSQPFIVEAEQDNCLAFGEVFLLSTSK